MAEKHKPIKRFFAVFFAALILTPVLLASVPPQTAEAKSSATWVNLGTLSFEDHTFKETKMTDTDWHFYYTDKDGCKSEIHGLNYDVIADGRFSGDKGAKLKRSKRVASGGCSETSEDITVKASPEGWDIDFVWSGHDRIATPFGEIKMDYSDTEDKNLYVRDDLPCPDYITIPDLNDPSHGLLFIRSRKGNSPFEDPKDSLRAKYRDDRNNTSPFSFYNDIDSGGGDIKLNGHDCHQSKKEGIPIRIGDPEKHDDDGVGDVGGGGDGSGGGGGAKDPCDSSGWSLTWFVCPILNGINSFLEFVTDRLVSLLEISTDKLLSSSTCTPGSQSGCLYKVWEQFRILSNIMFVIIGLVIIISQALSLEIISAYTAKRALPRLLIGVVMVQFSWVFCVLMVNLTNALGNQIQSIIYSPFGGSGNLTIQLSGQGAGLTLLIGAGVAAGIAIAGVFAVLTPVFLAMLLAVFAAFFVLVVRQAVIILLVCAAPLAFTAFILPHTQKMFKLWWGFFSKALVMYPMILALIASGRVFGSIITHANSGNSADVGFFYSIVGYIALYAPYFLIPATFKFAGGLIGNLGGMVNDRSRGIIDRSKKKRDAKIADNFDNWKRGDRFAGNNFMTKGLNQSGRHVGAGWRGQYGLTKDRQSVFDSQDAVSMAKRQQDPNFIANQHDDDMDRALAAGGSEENARNAVYQHLQQQLKSKVASGEITAAEAESQARTRSAAAAKKARLNVGFSAGSQAAGLQQMLLNKTAFRDVDDVHDFIAQASGGSENKQNALRGTISALSKQLGRHDLSGVSEDGISMASEALGNAPRSDFSQKSKDEIATLVAGGTSPDVARDTVRARRTSEATLKGAATADVATLVRDNDKAVSNITVAAQEKYREGAKLATSTDAGDAKRGMEMMETSRTLMQELRDSKPYATGKNTEHIEKAWGEIDAIDSNLRGASAGAAVDYAHAQAQAKKRTRDLPGENDPNRTQPPPATPGAPGP